MNLDLRSLNINNEIGILFFNEELAGKSARTFMGHIDKVAFRIDLDGNCSLRWKINGPGQEIIYEDEPYVGFWSKLSVWFIGLLPVESFL